MYLLVRHDATLSHRPSVFPFKTNINSFLSRILLKETFLEDSMCWSLIQVPQAERCFYRIFVDLLVSVLGAGAEDGFQWVMAMVMANQQTPSHRHPVLCPDTGGGLCQVLH